MKQSVIIIIAIAALALGAVVLFMNLTPDPPEPSQQPTPTDTSSQETNTESTDEQFLSGANISGAEDETNQPEVTVEIADFMFTPTTLTISQGTKVTWTNSGQMRHDVTSETDSGPGSELLSNGEGYSYTFGQTGTFRYYCSPHPAQMRGIIKVVD